MTSITIANSLVIITSFTGKQLSLAFSNWYKTWHVSQVRPLCLQTRHTQRVWPSFSLPPPHIYYVFVIQYCAKVTQAKCANFVLCSHALSRKVRAKVRVTIQGLLSEISLEQRTIFLRTFGRKGNFMMISVVSLIQCPKFHVGQTQQFLTRSIRSTRHIMFTKDIRKVFNTPSN